MTTLIAEHEKQDDNIVYLIEATHQNADFINALLNMRIVDEIIIYTVPFIAGTGFFLFQKIANILLETDRTEKYAGSLATHIP